MTAPATARLASASARPRTGPFPASRSHATFRRTALTVRRLVSHRWSENVVIPRALLVAGAITSAILASTLAVIEPPSLLLLGIVAAALAGTAKAPST